MVAILYRKQGPRILVVPRFVFAVRFVLSRAFPGAPALADLWAGAPETASTMQIGGRPRRSPTPRCRSLVVRKDFRVGKVSSPIINSIPGRVWS